MRLFDAGLAAGVLAILALADPAGATPVLSAPAALKTAADNPVTQVQWIGWGNGWQAPRYRWHKRPVFFRGHRRLKLRPPYGYSNWGYYNYGPVRRAPPHRALVVRPDPRTALRAQS